MERGYQNLRCDVTQVIGDGKAEKIGEAVVKRASAQLGVEAA